MDVAGALVAVGGTAVVDVVLEVVESGGRTVGGTTGAGNSVVEAGKEANDEVVRGRVVEVVGRDLAVVGVTTCTGRGAGEEATVAGRTAT